MIQPMITSNGVTSKAICILEPSATPIAKSILFFMAVVTAVICSAALPTIGSRIKPTNVSLKAPPLVIFSMELTSISAWKATKTVTATRAAMAKGSLILYVDCLNSRHDQCFGRRYYYLPDLY
ncbi:hypothetical protein BDF19DRAFT_440075 [Syncephalis fuscata]|nr:hypothetical protein BDF19DRAFT_440075 [Syncephalis fuscata]